MIGGALPSHIFLFTTVYCMDCIFIALALMSVFDLSPPWLRGMDTYSISSPDLREDALDEMMCRIRIQGEDQDFIDREREQEQLRRQANNFINAMSPGPGMSPGSRRVDVDPIPDVFNYSTSTPVRQLRHPSRPPMVDEYNYFNLQNIKTPIPPKWKDNENILEDFKKFKCSCIRIFDGPMVHITNGKVKTNMFLIWAGPDVEDIYENLRLPSTQQYVMSVNFEAFKRYCEPTCNFHVARFKFRSVKQQDGETINTFYHRILRLARQCQFENVNEHLIDAIVYSCKLKKAQDQLLQMPIRMTLEECLLICRHYESLQWHINTVCPSSHV